MDDSTSTMSGIDYVAFEKVPSLYDEYLKDKVHTCKQTLLKNFLLQLPNESAQDDNPMTIFYFLPFILIFIYMFIMYKERKRRDHIE
jgi:hypothetical protein